MSEKRLVRELGVFGATMLGLGSIVGTGVFVSIGIAAGAAGPSVILAIVLAGLLAACNALSSAQLAAAHPVSGGTYEYGYRLLNPALGFTAGWMFLCAKSASAATAALGVAGYTLRGLGIDPGGWLVGGALAVIALLTGLVLSGLRRSSLANILIVSITLLALAGFALAGFAQAGPQTAGRFVPFFPEGVGGALSPFLYATALMFVAYTGYGRIATMGEEVRNPETAIPRAIIVTLVVSAAAYAAVAAAAIATLGADGLGRAAAENATPLEAAARALGVPGLGTVLAIGAVTAMLGVLLNLILGLSRVVLAMGRRADLPPVLAGITDAGTPRSAVLVVGIAIAGLALIGDVETTWAFSAFTVLIYYGLTNLAALRLPRDKRLYPAVIAWAGLAGCLSLAAFLPRAIWLPGLALIGAGLAWHGVARRLRA